MPKPLLKKVPKFASEDEEREFWAGADSTEYIDWENGEDVRFPHLQPTTKTVSIRMPLWMIEELQVRANEHDVTYEALIKVYLAERLAAENQRPARAAAGT
jgi:predicted DNA binding CopG/RHH family protein